VKLAFHDLEALDSWRIIGHGVVDEKPGKIKKPGEPGHHEDDVCRLNPQHQLCVLSLLARRSSSNLCSVGKFSSPITLLLMLPCRARMKAVGGRCSLPYLLAVSP